MSGSTIMTIGTILRYADDRGADVSVLVEGHWITGSVRSIDSEGVLLSGDAAGQHRVTSLVRLQEISAVQVPDSAPAVDVNVTMLPQVRMAY